MKRILISIAVWLVALVSSFAQFSVPELPYKYDALEPYFDSTTMYIHLNNHHASYVNKLNTTLADYPELQKKSLDEILGNLNELPVIIQTTVRNTGGGHYNHSLFWKILAPAGSTKMSNKLSKILKWNFGSVDNFKLEFEKAATSQFGSGWAWLVKEPSGKLTISSTANQDNPIMADSKVKGKPDLALDVWEHAYYLKYQSKRAAFSQAFWNVVNWDEVEKLILE
jgi:Fe-Mn family superoxide dismutase